MSNRFYVWLVTTLLIATGIFWTAYSGIISTIYHTDDTHLTSIIGVIYIIGLLINGYVSYNYQLKSSLSSGLDTSWFLSELVMGLGMTGTVIGIIMLLGVGHSINIQSPEALPQIITKMWSTLGVAFYPNVVGLLASMTLKIQTHLLEKNG